MGEITNETVDEHLNELSNGWENLNYLKISKSFEFTNFIEAYRLYKPSG